MLNYNDKRWDELKGGYGIPYNPVNCLMNLEAGVSTSEVWEELWNELHHQGDIGEASYAVIPHLVHIHNQSKALDWNLYALASVVEVERHRCKNPPLPKWLEQPYKQAWHMLFQLALVDLKEASDEITVRAIISAIALAKGQLKLGALINNLDSSEIEEYLEETVGWSELYR